MTAEEMFLKNCIYLDGGEYNIGLDKAHEAMEEYARQQVVEFQKWTNLNGWFWSPNRWLNYHDEANPKTTEELYILFLQSQSK